MTRLSKQAERRQEFPRKRVRATAKTGPRKDNLPLGFKQHANAASGDLAAAVFVSKVR